MTNSIFFRLLDESTDDKGTLLEERISDLKAEGEAAETYILNPASFSNIPGSSFAYWISDSISELFRVQPSFEPTFGEVRTGLQSLGADDIFIRAWWEVPSNLLGREERWVGFAKGGESRIWLNDIYLVTDWANDGTRQKQFAKKKYNSVTRKITGMALYFRPGITYTAYTNKGFFGRILPRDCIFSLAGPGIFPQQEEDTLWILGILNSSLVEFCLRLMTDRRKWEPGYVKSLPFTRPSIHQIDLLERLVSESLALSRTDGTCDELTHDFRLPSIVWHFNESVQVTGQKLELTSLQRASKLVSLHADIDSLVFGIDEASQYLAHNILRTEIESEDDIEIEDYISRIENLWMWCMGVAFGRWDVRKALDPSLLPPLGGPFDPLPRCAPGALMGSNGLPATPDEVNNDYPLPIAWNGILVDDPDNPEHDIVARVRGVLQLLWGDQAADIEQEILDILKIDSLREYFRNPRRFFEFHIKRYSKSRRKAPIYWLLQSANRNYGIWLYYHRLAPDTLFVAAREYADHKVAFAENRLDDLRRRVETASGTERKHLERDADSQAKLVAEVTEFRDTLDELALRKLPPDMNDGVVISIAPLHQLVPWKEAEKYWGKLVAGEYEWSTMSKQMKAHGLAKG